MGGCVGRYWEGWEDTQSRGSSRNGGRGGETIYSLGLCVCVILKAVILATLPLMYFYPRWPCQISPFVLTPAGLKNGLWHLTAFPAPLNCAYTLSMLTQYTLKCTQTAPDVVETRFFRFTPASDSNASQVSSCDWVSPPCSHCFFFLWAMDCWVHHSGWSFLHGIHREFICIHNAPRILLTSACLETCIHFFFFFFCLKWAIVLCMVTLCRKGMMNNTTENKAEVHWWMCIMWRWTDGQKCICCWRHIPRFRCKCSCYSPVYCLDSAHMLKPVQNLCVCVSSAG